MLTKSNIFMKICLSIMALYIIFSSFSMVYATEGGELLTKMENDAEAFLTAGAQNSGNINYNNIANQFKGLGQILTMVGAGVMVAVTTYMGIKYLTAGPEAQAKLKIQLIGVVVSGMVIFGAYSIWKLVIQIASQF